MQEKIELRKFVVKQKGRAEALPKTTGIARGGYYYSSTDHF
jgi:hypothetical protein